MKRPVRPIPRLVTFCLLVLAVSPVTAPFSSFDLADVFHPSRSDHAAIVHAKSHSDKLMSGVWCGFEPALGSSTLQAVSRLVDRPASHPPHVPLRI
jgi:hypothetical protein